MKTVAAPFFHMSLSFICTDRMQEARGQNAGNSSTSKGKNRQGKSVRLNINARERRRMHDLNDALDELR